MILQWLSSDNSDFSELWPSLKVVCCWTSASAGLQLPALSLRLPQVSFLETPFAATEGWITTSVAEVERGTVFHPGAHIVEFLPVESALAKDRLLQFDQLSAKQSYEMFFTTAMGMVRYRIFDIVRCLGFYKGSPILEFQSKAGKWLSLGLTKIHENQLIEAIQESRARMPEHFAFGPSQNGMALALYSTLSTEEGSQLAQRIEGALSNRHSEYADHVARGLSESLGYFRVSQRQLPQIHHPQSKPQILVQEALHSSET